MSHDRPAETQNPTDQQDAKVNDTPDDQVRDQGNPPQVVEVTADLSSCLAFSCGSGGTQEDGIGWSVDWDGLPEWQQEIEAGGDLSCQATCLASFGYTEGSELVGSGSADVSNWQTNVTTQSDIDQKSGAALSPNLTDSVNSSNFHENVSITDYEKGTTVEFEHSPGAGGTLSITDQSGAQVYKELSDNWRQASVTAPDGTTYIFEKGVNTPSMSWTVEKPNGTIETGGGLQMQDAPQQNHSFGLNAPAFQSMGTQSAGGVGMPAGAFMQNQTDYSRQQFSTTSSGHPASTYGASSELGSTGTIGPPTESITSHKGFSSSAGGSISPGTAAGGTISPDTASERSTLKSHNDIGASKSEIAPGSSSRPDISSRNHMAPSTPSMKIGP